MCKKDVSEYKTPDDIVKCNCLNEEAEFTINGAREEDTCTICVNDNLMLTKIKNSWKLNPKAYRVIQVNYNQDGTVFSYIFETSKKNISLRSGASL